MKYSQPVVDAARLGTRNSISLVLVSTIISITSIPLATSILIAPTYGWLVGMWTTCLLWGVVVIGGFEQCIAIVDRRIHTGTAPFWNGVRRSWRDGLVIGATTFCVSLGAVGLVALPYDGLYGTSLVLLAGYLTAGWIVLLAFSLPSYARVDGAWGLYKTFETGFARILRAPRAAVWFIVQSVGWLILSVLTIVTPFLLLPGFLMLLAVTITDAAEDANAGVESVRLETAE